MKERIEEYSTNTSRFHMPGHSGADIDGKLYSVAKYDITELDFSDNLQHPTGDIKALEDKIATIYSSKRAFMLTQGATAGIQIALLVAREVKGVLYLYGETHKSCISFASVIGLKVISLDSMDEAIDKVKSGEWVYVTSPNYYGMTLDLLELISSRANGGAVIVDEAHGAHYVFSSLLPISMSSRADFVIESLHKTLPVFTGGAVLNVNNVEYIDMAEYFKCKIHSTSPSYLIMQSIDSAMEMMSDKGEELYAAVKEAVDDFVASLDDRYYVENTHDFSRVVINTDNAEDVALYLQNRGTYIELFDDKRLVLIVTPFNMHCLLGVAKTLNSYIDSSRAAVDSSAVHFALKRAKGYQGALKFVPIRESQGYVSMSEVAIYPPGVPIITSGDIITSEVIDYVLENKEKIVGLINDTIAVREICEEN